MAVTPENIAVALGRIAPEVGSTEYEQWSLWIEDAARAIERRAERLGIDPASLNQVDVDYVIRESVVAQVRRPDSATQVTVSVDDASTSRTYSSGSGRVTILADWWDLLGLAGSTGVAFEIDTMPSGAGVGPPGVHGRDYAWSTPTDWVILP